MKKKTYRSLYLLNSSSEARLVGCIASLAFMKRASRASSFHQLRFLLLDGSS